MNDVKILQTASYLPQQVINNSDLVGLMDTSDEWISQRTGIHQRHISRGENTSDLAVQVAKSLLASEKLLANQIDLIIVATMSPDSYTPSTAALVQGQLGAKNALAFDISAACSGFVYGLNVAFDMISADDNLQFALVIGAEVLSKLIDWHDRRTAVLFGDGAGGVLLGRKSGKSPTMLGKDLRTFGQFGNQIVAGQTQVEGKFPPTSTSLSTFEMDGRGVYKFATHEVPNSIRRATRDAGLNLADIDCFVLHQANSRIVKQVAKRLAQPVNKFPLNISKIGNTAAASEPILLDELIDSGQIRRGDVVALSGFGGGLTTGTIIFKY